MAFYACTYSEYIMHALFIQICTCIVIYIILLMCIVHYCIVFSVKIAHTPENSQEIIISVIQTVYTSAVQRIVYTHAVVDVVQSVTILNIKITE